MSINGKQIHPRLIERGFMLPCIQPRRRPQHRVLPGRLPLGTLPPGCRCRSCTPPTSPRLHAWRWWRPFAATVLTRGMNGLNQGPSLIPMTRRWFSASRTPRSAGPAPSRWANLAGVDRGAAGPSTRSVPMTGNNVNNGLMLVLVPDAVNVSTRTRDGDASCRARDGCRGSRCTLRCSLAIGCRGHLGGAGRRR
jgi:hypothetical protein